MTVRSPAHEADPRRRAIGCRTVDGTRMLLHQFCGQVELYTGRPAPFAVMSTALLDEIARVG
jgi:shikimate dehydrogenase